MPPDPWPADDQVKIRVQLPARRAYSPEGGPGFGPPRRGGGCRWITNGIMEWRNGGMVASGSESLRIGESNGILGMKNG